MANEKTALFETLSSYKKMASDPNIHSHLTKDKTMIQFLAYCLDSCDHDVLETSLLTLDLLVQTPSNRPSLKSTFGILEALKTTSNRQEIDSTLRALSLNLHDILLYTVEETPKSGQAPLPPPQESNCKVNPSKLYAFHVFGLNEETRNDLEFAILRTRGVISVLIDVPHLRSLVRCTEKVTAKTIAENIACKANMKTKLVIKNKKDQEVLVDILDEDEDVKDSLDDLNDLPAYLPEDDSPVKEKAILSLDRFKSNASSWFKTASAFLQESFYW